MSELARLRRELAQRHEEMLAHGIVLLEIQNELRDTRAAMTVLVVAIATEPACPPELKLAAAAARRTLARYAGAQPAADDERG